MISVRFKKSIVWIVALSLLLSIAVLPSSAESGSVEDMRSEIEELEQKAQEIAVNIAALQQDASKQEELKAQLQRQMTNTQSQIDLVTNEAMRLSKSVTELEGRIAENEAQLDSAKQEFKQRLRAMYMTGSQNELMLLLGSDDVADYLSKTELTKSVSKRDNALMEEIVTRIGQIQDSRIQLTAEYEEKSAVQEQLSRKQADLTAQVSETQALITKLGIEEQQLVDEKVEAEEAVAEYENRIAAALEEARREEEARQEAERQESENGGASFEETPDDSNTESDSSGGSFDLLWPVKGFHYITSPYGWRIHPIYGTRRFHSGIDIADWGIDGQPVLAAEDGVISLTDYNDGGYGYYVMVYHGENSDGDEYATLYAHLKRYTVSEGQYVKKGDVIGYVGTSGASTGSHLHYEVRVNGETTDPVSYY